MWWGERIIKNVLFHSNWVNLLTFYCEVLADHMVVPSSSKSEVTRKTPCTLLATLHYFLKLYYTARLQISSITSLKINKKHNTNTHTWCYSFFWLENKVIHTWVRHTRNRKPHIWCNISHTTSPLQNITKHMWTQNALRSDSLEAVPLMQ